MAEKERNVPVSFLVFSPLVSLCFGHVQNAKMAEFSGVIAWQSRKVSEVFRCHLINQDMCLTKA